MTLDPGTRLQVVAEHRARTMSKESQGAHRDAYLEGVRASIRSLRDGR